MSLEKTTGPCNKFQANIFNKTKCQNCFKSRELHLLNEHDLEQAKPIYAGWLCLAPVGTDFDNLMQRSRKWQRRFFILYEHGSLSFALDEQLSTLPQGTVNMTQCTDITDAEPRTGQRNALCIVTLEQEIFIRGDNKEIINGWSEQLAVYLRTNKQNQKKKRKVEPISTQEPSPAKMAATDPSFPSSKNAAVSDCVHWQEDHQGRGPGVNPTWTVADTVPPGPEQIPAGNSSTYLFPVSRDSIVCPVGSLDLVTAGNIINQLAESNKTSAHNNQNQSQDKSPSERLLGFKASKKEQEGTTAVSRTGRSEARTSRQEKLQSCGDMNHLTAPPPQRRARSLDRRTSDTVMTQDVLNFKKGWMIKLDESEQWKKYWFVLSTDSLRYYKDSVAEEALDLEGEIDLTRCYNVSEYQVQRNYGFQIHNPKGVFTLSAMTSGIRKNWIQALMKKVHQANAPDVASLPAHHGPCCPPEALPKPDVTQDSPISGGSTDFHPKHRTVMERRREGRYRTFDWAEFRPQNRPTVDTDPDRSKALCSLELGDLERRKRREERRRRYESMLGISLSWENGGKAVDVSMRALSPNSQQNVEEEMEECWKLVEKTAFRMGRSVPLFTAAKDMQTENLLDSYRKEVEHLKALLADSDRCRLELEAQLRTEGYYWLQLDSSLSSETDINPKGKHLNGHTPTLKDTHKEIREVMKHPSLQVQPSFEPPPLRHQAPSILLPDTDGKLQEVSDALPPESDAAPLLSPASGNQDLLFQSDGEANHGTELDREDHQQKETQLECSPLILENPSEGDGELLNCFVENHIPPDQTLVRKLSQMLELLTSQNDALNQRNQELVNQLTEADREIERLKAELSRRHSEPHHLPEVEQRQAVGDLEKELNLRNQQLLEAQTLISSLQENLRETDVLLQLNLRTETEETGQEKSAEKAEEYLHLCLEDKEAKLTELEKQLDQSKTTCRELQTQNADLKEAEELNRQTAAEAEAEVRRLSQELEKEKEKERVRDKKSSGEERIQQVIEGMIMRLNILGKLLEVIDMLDVGLRKNEDDENTSQLKWEKEFWRSLHSKLNPSQTKENSVEVLLGEVTERMLLERELLLLGNDLLSETDEGRDEKTDESRILDFNYQPCEIKQFRDGTQMKISSLNRLASVSTSACEKLQLMADKLSQGLPWSAFIHSAATEALYCYQLSRLQAKYDRELEESKQNLYSSSLICNKCLALMEENREMRARLSNLEEQQKTISYCQTEETHPQVTEPGTVEGIQKENLHCTPETPEEEMIESLDSDCMEVQLCADGQLETQETEDDNKMESDASHEDANSKEEEVLFLKRRVTELEEQLSIMEEEMKEEFDVKIRGFQCQHEKDIEKLKVTCERGFLSMEDSHVKVVEELQRRYQQEVERLLVERDRLLEEESAATATAIEAIEKAHRLELEREVQRRCQSERNTGNAHLEDIYRQHGEELTSHQRELQVLSQQFSLKCLENGHLVQALDAERKALCQCQKENQDLRTRNQELSGHLAAEITRLCSLAKQDKSLLTQGMDVYEMEITLRVKESEVQCLKQEITSLKDELQAAQRDKRNATKKYKDMYTELSIMRAKTEREMDDLRENLRLAHRALDQTSP